MIRLIPLSLAFHALALLAGSPPETVPVEEILTPDEMLAQAESLLEDDQYEDALDLAGSVVDRWPAGATGHVLKARALYRRGDFDESEHHFRRAIELDPEDAEAHFGLGRILRTLGRYGDAAEHFSRAAALGPEVPRYLRILANHVSKRSDSIGLLERYLELVEKEDSGENEVVIGNVKAWIALLRKMGDEPLSQLARGEPTTVPLSVKNGQAYVRVDVAGLRKQKFVFDTGATGFTVSPRIARRAKLVPIRPYTIAGTGAGRTETGDLVVVDELSIGDGIVLRNVPATVREPGGPEEGLIGPSLFSALNITIDMKRGTLAFERRGAARPGHAEKFRNVGGEIVITSRVNGQPFNSMVDTGSASTIIGKTTVERLPGLEAAPGQWFAGTTVGVGGALADRRVILAGSLSFAGRDYPADGLLSGNLDGISQALQSEIYVILGAAHLDDFVITIDYEAMTVTFQDRAKTQG